MTIKGCINLCRFIMGIIPLKPYFPNIANHIQLPASFGCSFGLPIFDLSTLTRMESAVEERQTD